MSTPPITRDQAHLAWSALGLTVVSSFFIYSKITSNNLKAKIISETTDSVSKMSDLINEPFARHPLLDLIRLELNHFVEESDEFTGIFEAGMQSSGPVSG